MIEISIKILHILFFPALYLMNTNLSSNKLMCHRTCNEIKEKGGYRGVATVLYNNYYNRKDVVLLGKERAGDYCGEYNLCAGGMDGCDNGCFLEAIKREMIEEFKIDVRNWMTFDRMFKNNNNKIRYFIYNGTPIFIGVLNGVSRIPLNTKITACNKNTSLGWCHREMENVDYFTLDGKQIEGTPNLKISKFALECMKKLDLKKL